MEGLKGHLGSIVADFVSPEDSEVSLQLFNDVPQCTQAAARGYRPRVRPEAIPSPSRTKPGRMILSLLRTLSLAAYYKSRDQWFGCRR